MNRNLFRPSLPTAATLAGLLLWLGVVLHWMASPGAPGPVLRGLEWIVFLGSLPLAVYWARRARSQPTIRRNAIFSGCFVLAWPPCLFLADVLELYEFRAFMARAGVAGLFFIGLAWVVWYVERSSKRYAQGRVERRPPSRPQVHPAAVQDRVAADGPERRIWNPLDLEAWYYGRRGKKLNQSLFALASYSVAFLALFLLLNQLGGCQEIYEMPAGGGQQQTIAQTLKLQKVIKKKFVINPFSAIIFNPPPIDEVKLQLMEVTSHAYTVGYGQGAGAGFSGGTGRGKVRFIRLEYGGGDWNQDFGIGADLNMLIQYGVRTGHPVHNQTESRSVAQLGNFVVGKSPPLVYLTGQRNISVSKSEVKILREYLLDQHGMLFGDNGGSSHFHNQFFAMMRQVLPGVEPVRVPLDDVIHRVPYQIPFLPYVAPHGGKDAWGWKVDGRWVCYYHPGDIADAWGDDHSGVSPEVWEACYQLGTNVIFYGHVEYNKWLDARQQK